MKKLLPLATVFAMLALSPVHAATSFNTDFIDSEGNKIGTATLQEVSGGTLLSVDLQLPEGTHAIHIHENAACDAPDFKSAGGHFNPTHHKHGLESMDGAHAGDLPNLYVESTDHIKADILSSQLHLTGKNGLNKGVAIVIHEKADDYSTDPSGNAGNRIACAVVKF